jgi:hypothetical protein
MTAQLSRAQLRSARRVAARLRASGAGSLVIAIGASAGKRTAFEAALLAEGLALATGTIDDSSGPWQQIAAIAGTQALASVGWSGDDETQQRIVDALNLGRESIHALPAGVLLWIGGLGSIESFPKLAPDLWAFRVSVVWVLGTEDFESGPVAVDASTTYDARLRDIEKSLAKLDESDSVRISLLVSLALILREVRRFEAARAAAAEAVRIWDSMSDETRAWSHVGPLVWWASIEQAHHDRRDDDVLAMLNDVDWRAWSDWSAGPDAQLAATQMAAVAGYRGHDGLADEALQTALRRRWDGLLASGGLLADICVYSMERGDLEATRTACAKAEAAGQAPHDWMVLAFVASTRAEAAAAELRLHDALVEHHRAWRAHLDHGALLRLPSALGEIVSVYESMGLVHDALQLVARVDADGAAHRARLFAAMGNADAACDEARHVLKGMDPNLPPFERVVSYFQAIEPIIDMLDALLDRRALAPIRELVLNHLDALIELARENRQTTLVQHATAGRLQFFLDLGHVDEAESLLPELLAWSQAYEGPRLRAQRHLAAAKVAFARRDPERATAAVDAAELALREEVERLQSRYVWRQILETRADTLAMQGNFADARATLLDAHDRMHAAGLEREALRVLHRLAEPLLDEPSDAEALASREPAALAALRISAAAGLVREEARALANVAVVHAERGRAEPAHKMLDEAIWLAEGHLGLQAHLDRCSATIRNRE